MWRPRATYANVTSSLALVVALSGGAYAASALPRHSVGTPQLKAGAVTSGKVADGALRAQDFARGQLPAGPRGPRGAEGPPGPTGDTGLQGPAGTNGTDGRDGTDGTNGQDGTNGKDGTDGQDGAPGPVGPSYADSAVIPAQSPSICQPSGELTTVTVTPTVSTRLMASFGFHWSTDGTAEMTGYFEAGVNEGANHVGDGELVTSTVASGQANQTSRDWVSNSGLLQDQQGQPVTLQAGKTYTVEVAAWIQTDDCNQAASVPNGGYLTIQYAGMTP